MAKDKKYYVIFKGHNPGVYDDWGDARDQVEGYPNPVYKGYGSAAEAAEAYRRYSKKEDAGDLGNPGKMEYQGVELMTGRTLFRIGPFEDATNNIGEFLAIVHAMALMTKEGRFHNIYSDSVSGMAWVRNGKIKTQLKTTPRNGKVFELMARAVTWLHTHQFPCKVLKWQTDRWGEIPADFGRK